MSETWMLRTFGAPKRLSSIQMLFSRADLRRWGAARPRRVAPTMTPERMLLF